MNKREKAMFQLLNSLRDAAGAAYVRAEFEAEGLRLEELMRLKEISVRAGLPLSLKIGGCEGVRDLLETKVLGTEMIVAPMIESGFSLRKYAQALNKVYPNRNTIEAEHWFNLETKTAYKNLDSILGEPVVSQMTGVVIERVDLSFSLGLTADDVDSPEVTSKVKAMAIAAKAKGLKVAVGGGVAARSIPFFLELRSQSALDFVETRKVGFDLAHPGLTEKLMEEGFLKAVAFEILFLENRMQFRSGTFRFDSSRVGYLQQRYGDILRELLPDYDWTGVKS